MRILLVEDDAALSRFIGRGLADESDEVMAAGDGIEALEQFAAWGPDLVVMDLNLPRLDGMEVLHAIRSRDVDTPVLILTGRSEIAERLRCLDLGADDFLLKPFSMAELRARTRALKRRKANSGGLTLRSGSLELNRVEHRVLRGGREIPLTRTEYALLECLMLHRGRAVSRASLLREVWRETDGTGTNIVDVYVNYLRKKLGADGPSLIRTVRGLGYAFGAVGQDEAHPPVKTNLNLDSDLQTKGADKWPAQA